MSNTSERAKKAALTRAHRQALQALSDKKLITSASGPCTAKVKALEDPVWNAVSTKRRGQSPDQQTQAMQPKCHKKQGLPAALIESSEDEEVVDEQPKRQPKTVASGSVKVKPKGASQKRLEDEESDSSSQSDLSQDEDGSELGSGSESNDLMRIDAKALERVFADEHPEILESNVEEDEDHDADMALISRRSLSRSSCRSVPPLTDSDIVVSEYDNQDEEEDLELAKRKTGDTVTVKRTKAPKGRRENAFQAEKPKVVKDSIKLRKHKNNDAMQSDSDWPTHAQLNAISTVTKEIVLQNSFPETDSKVKYRRQVIIEAAKAAKDSFQPIGDIYDRAKQDGKFCDALGQLVTDRLSGVRNPIMASATTEIAVFQLGTGTLCMERVNILLNHNAFIFPGFWDEDGRTGKMRWNHKAMEPFLNPAFIQILKMSFFLRPTSIGSKIRDQFVSSIDGHDEPELPIAMVALVATAVYAALYEWKTGARIIIKFEGNVFATIYRGLYNTLETIKSTNRTAFHAIMSKLYSLVVTSRSAEVGGEGTLELMDLSGYA
ncbi:hypothetical protein BJV78DRAFT_1287423 [Lactifluus subvellereus]|nr:hypothetical protein BJV78DRAFT_1287423 [Lactifluus subvellereus]